MSAKESSVSVSRLAAVVRIVFGLMWAVDAILKWRPGFQNGFLDQIKDVVAGQPHWVQHWLNVWIHLFSYNPHAFAVAIAIIETSIAICLLLGFGRKPVYILAAIFSMLVWTIPEAFGSPYGSSSTDIGTGAVYALVFLALYGLDKKSHHTTWSLDVYISKQIPWWAVIATP